MAVIRRPSSTARGCSSSAPAVKVPDEVTQHALAPLQRSTSPLSSPSSVAFESHVELGPSSALLVGLRYRWKSPQEAAWALEAAAEEEAGETWLVSELAVRGMQQVY